MGQGDADDEAESFGIELHAQPFAVHGGVLLGSTRSSNFIETAWRENRALRDPLGNLLFKNEGDDVHLWHSSQILGTQNGPSQYVVFRNARIVQSLASEGHLLIAIQAMPGAVVREELRGFSAPELAAEWFRTSQGSDGAVLLSKVARLEPCANALYEDCVVVVTARDAAAVKEQMLPDGRLPLTIVFNGDGLWVADFDVSYLLAEFTPEESEEPSSSSLREKVRALSRWGFQLEASNLYATRIGNFSKTSVDTLMTESLTRNSLADMFASLVAVGEIARVEAVLEGPGTSLPLKRLRAAQRLVANVPDADRPAYQARLGGSCERMKALSEARGAGSKVPQEVLDCVVAGRIGGALQMKLEVARQQNVDANPAVGEESPPADEPGDVAEEQDALEAPVPSQR
jgi:hypothetical protein